jgi:hypothetical protein
MRLGPRRSVTEVYLADPRDKSHRYSSIEGHTIFQIAVKDTATVLVGDADRIRLRYVESIVAEIATVGSNVRKRKPNVAHQAT